MAGQADEPDQEVSSDESKANLIGFFNLLLEIDMRNNPDLYRVIQEDEHD